MVAASPRAFLSVSGVRPCSLITITRASSSKPRSSRSRINAEDARSTTGSKSSLGLAKMVAKRVPKARVRSVSVPGDRDELRPGLSEVQTQVDEVADMARLNRGEKAIDDTLRHNLAEETTVPRVCGLAIDA